MRVPNPQPAKAIIALRPEWNNRKLAYSVDVSEHQLGRVLNGYEEPSPRLAADLASVLGVPQNMLFRASEQEVGA